MTYGMISYKHTLYFDTILLVAPFTAQSVGLDNKVIMKAASIHPTQHSLSLKSLPKFSKNCTKSSVMSNVLTLFQELSRIFAET